MKKEGNTIKFDSWEEHNQYLLDNFPKSCINCKFGSKGEVRDSPYVFCTEPKNGMLMANLIFGKFCDDWESCE